MTADPLRRHRGRRRAPAGAGARSDGPRQHLVAAAAVAAPASARCTPTTRRGTAGRDVLDPHPISTEQFVGDLGDAVATLRRARGADRPLDGWPAFVVPGRRTARAGVARSSSRTWRRTSAAAPPARGSRGCMRCPSSSPPSRRCSTSSGRSPAGTSLEAFDRTPTGWRLHGRPERWVADRRGVGHPRLLEQWQAVRVPTLLIEAGNSVTPPGQMRQMHETGLQQQLCATCRAPVTWCTTTRRRSTATRSRRS